MPNDPAAIFRCPECHAEVVFDTESALCRNESCRRAYPITRGIPEMLLDHSQELSRDVWNRRIDSAK